MNYYNEIDAHAAETIRQLIEAGLIPPGDVDERSITDVRPDDLKGYTQCHFFAGIAGWSLALRIAGWPDDRPVWTGSCPCQPFSSAGKRKGHADERHLWPEFHRLIRECRPDRVFGEQVASAIGHGWLDGVFADLEAEGYACGAVVLGAHSVGAPHIRQRLWWMADAGSVSKRESRGVMPAITGERDARHNAGECGIAGHLEHPESDGGWRRVVFAADCEGFPDGDCADCPVCGIDYAECDCPGPTQDGYEYEERDGVMYARWVGESVEPGLEGHAGDERDGNEPGRVGEDADGSASTSGGAGGGAGTPWLNFDIIHFRDGKARRIEPGTSPLVDGLPRGMVRGNDPGRPHHPAEARSARIKGYGNAINPYVAAEFIRAAGGIE